MIYSKILFAIESALAIEAVRAASLFCEPKNVRAYVCSAEGCERKAYAKGLCNAHYIRVRKGKEMKGPVKARKRNATCTECGVETRGKSGWGLCSRHYKQKRRAAIKDAVIEALGGACKKCGGVFSRAVFDFHHVSGKDKDPIYVISNGSPEEIAEELAKCRLLCANCHRMEHADDD